MNNRKSNNLDINRKAVISINTCAIGALADVENNFGEIFGHGKPYDKLTDEQKIFRQKWNKIRNSILSRAENSKRILLRELKKLNNEKYVTIIRSKDVDGGYNG